MSIPGPESGFRVFSVLGQAFHLATITFSRQEKKYALTSFDLLQLHLTITVEMSYNPEPLCLVVMCMETLAACRQV